MISFLPLRTLTRSPMWRSRMCAVFLLRRTMYCLPLLISMRSGMSLSMFVLVRWQLATCSLQSGVSASQKRVIST